MDDPIVIIPARMGSKRFPAKPVHKFAGKTLIEHTVAQARKTRLRVVVATDDSAVERYARQAGAEVVATGPCNNGTERCIEAASKIGHRGSIINWQGDAPLIDPQWAIDLLDFIEMGVSVATPIQLCTYSQVDRIKLDASQGRSNATTVAMLEDGRAQYFSKSPIPFRGPYWMHIGLYAISAAAAPKYGRRMCNLEASEGLEQLRWYGAGVEINCMAVSGEVWEVNQPDDISIVENLMRKNDAVA